MEYTRSHKLLYMVTGLVLGALVFAALRFSLYKPDSVHYHANFALYINGTRDEFKDPSFYEEESACSDSMIGPKHRAHMHDNINDVVHVHDQAVTWGAFLANIGYGVGGKYLQARTKLYVADETNKLHFVLNGKDVGDVTDAVIGDQDRLLISYGSEDAKAVQGQFDGVAKSAAKIDSEKDPAACSGPEAVTWQDRLNHIFR